MKRIAIIAVTAVVLLDIALFQFTGAVAQSSRGGTIALTLAFLLAACAVGVREAWSKKRSVLGGTMSTAISIFGAVLATSLSGIFLGPILEILNLDESTAATHPLRFIASAGMMVHTLLGAWIALSVADRWR